MLWRWCGLVYWVSLQFLVSCFDTVIEVFARHMASSETRCDYSLDSGQRDMMGSDAGEFLGHTFIGNEGMSLLLLLLLARVQTSWWELGEPSWSAGWRTQIEKG